MYEEYSLSTSWAGNKFATGRDLIETFKSMGFHKAELNYHVSRSLYEDILQYVDRGEFEVTSVHHPFPKEWTEEFGTDSVMLGFQDENKRLEAVKLTQKSIDCGVRLKAKAVVIHLSEVPFLDGEQLDNKLKTLYTSGEKYSLEYRNTFGLLKDHRMTSHTYVKQVVKSLKDLCKYIEKMEYDIVLGIENRAMSHQIPDYYEAEYILKELKGYPVYFWYDHGHGVMMENLGMFDNKAGLEKIIHQTAGAHIHDVEGMMDHRAPYELNDMLDAFVPLLKRIPIKVLEIGESVDQDKIISGMKRLKHRMDM